MSGRSPYTNEAYGGEQGVAGPSGTVGGYAPGMDSNALENAIQVRISGSLHVGCILSAKCKMPKGSRKARFKWQRLGRLGPRSKENLPDGKTATYQIKPEDAGCWLRVACAPLLADGTVGPISSAISRKRISGTPILNAETLAFLESQPQPANAWDGPSAKQLKWMNLMDQTARIDPRLRPSLPERTGASMAEVDVSSEEHAREARLSQSSNNQGQGHKRQGSGSSNRSDTNGMPSPHQAHQAAGASPLAPGSRDSFRDAEFFSPPVFIPKIPPMDIPFTPQTAHDGGAAAAAAAAARGMPSPAPFPNYPPGAGEVTPPAMAAWNRGQSSAGADSMALVPDRIPQTPIWASLTAAELDRLFRDFTFAQREAFQRGQPTVDENGNPLPTRAEDIMRFAEENTKPGQTRAEALMSIAASVAKDAPPSVKRSDLLMELAETIPPSPNRAQLLMQLFMAAEEAPTPYRA